MGWAEWGALGGPAAGAGSGGGWDVGSLPHGGTPAPRLGCFSPIAVVQRRGLGSPCHPAVPVAVRSSLPGRWQLPRWHLGPALISRRRLVPAGVVPEPQPGDLGRPCTFSSLQTPSVPAETVPEAGGSGRAAECWEPPPPVDTCPGADRCRAQPGSAKTSPSTFGTIPPLRGCGRWGFISPHPLLDGGALR